MEDPVLVHVDEGRDQLVDEVGREGGREELLLLQESEDRAAGRVLEDQVQSFVVVEVPEQTEDV